MRLILFKNVLLKGSMEISMYPVRLRLIQKFCTERVHGNFLVSCNIETNSKMFLPKIMVHGNFHVPCNINFETYIRNSLPKGSMEISMYPHGHWFRNSLPNGSREISMYPVTLRLIQKFCTERVHGNFLVSCNIETNSKMFLPKIMVHGNFHVPCNINFETISEILYQKGPWNFHVPSNIETNNIQKCFSLKHPWIFPCIR